MDSILASIKKLLGISPDDLNFDEELIIHINGAIMVVNQLGVGPETGYLITDINNTWDELLNNRSDLELVKNDIHLRVKLSFDPPQNSFLVAAIKDQLKEFDWRIEINSTAPGV